MFAELHNGNNSTGFSSHNGGHSRIQEQQYSVFSSNEKLRELLNNIPDMVMMLNSNQEAVYGNTHMREFIDQGEETKFTGRKIGDIFNCVNAKLSPGGCGSSPKCSQCGAFHALADAKKNLKATYEYTLNRQGKEENVFQVWTMPLFINGELFIKFIMRDIGEIKQKQMLETVFLRDLAQLTEVLMSKLEHAKQNPYSRESLFEEVYFLSNEIHDLIQSQQDLLAAEDDRLKTELSDINSYCELQNIIRDMKPTLQKNDKNIVVREDSDKVFFQCDKRLLKRVIRHMLSNAIEATPPGENIHAECVRKEDNVLFKIHNNTFIPEDVQKQLFKRSFSTKGEGRGMGTYSMRLFAEKYLNGEVSCSSSQKNGTTFVVSLPFIKI